MVWREGEAPGLGAVPGSGKSRNSGGSTAKITVLVVVMAFLLVTIALVALQPSPHPTAPLVAEVEPEPQPVAASLPVTSAPALPVESLAVVPPAPEPPKPAPSPVVAQEVTRADASLLELRQAVRSNEASDVLWQLAGSPGAGPDNLPLLARSVLGGFGYAVREGDRLHALLVASLSNQKSDAYIDALLNTAAARGEFTPPYALVLPSGRMDTQSLLQAMVRAARS